MASNQLCGSHKCTCNAVGRLLQLLDQLLVMIQHLLTLASVLTGVPGCFHSSRDIGRWLQMPGLQRQGGGDHKEADTLPVSPSAGVAPQAI